ncbi:hypothetical protein [Psychroflexus salis]|uniref:Uncharacterized protein n=1 Tax=Psychroflexus salis TaxID=1526574 RepID=A0A917E9K3_9FLAO|nr:hypothetical protein [Psychroflexus salis]GGE17432.1 hypothetical protein GCM10010831_18350 [Psychroflexus salis]
MGKIYTKKTPTKQILMPKKSTLNFILNYSKALHVQNYKGMQVDLIIN